MLIHLFYHHTYLCKLQKSIGNHIPVNNNSKLLGLTSATTCLRSLDCEGQRLLYEELMHIGVEKETYLPSAIDYGQSSND